MSAWTNGLADYFRADGGLGPDDGLKRLWSSLDGPGMNYLTLIVPKVECLRGHHFNVMPRFAFPAIEGLDLPNSHDGPRIQVIDKVAVFAKKLLCFKMG
jgi:hypothetical protein